jgi:hypothetical protein
MGKQTPHGSLANRTIRTVSLVDEVRQKFSSVAGRAVVSLELSLSLAYPTSYEAQWSSRTRTNINY